MHWLKILFLSRHNEFSTLEIFKNQLKPKRYQTRFGGEGDCFFVLFLEFVKLQIFGTFIAFMVKTRIIGAEERLNSTGCSYKGPKFNSQDPHDSLNTSIDLIIQNPGANFDL